MHKKAEQRGWFTVRFLSSSTTVSSGVSQYRCFHLPGACRDRRDITVVLLDALPFTDHRFSLADSQINIFKATQATEWYWTNNLRLTHKSFRKVSARFQEIEKFALFLSAFFQILVTKKLSLFYHLHCYRAIAQLPTLIQIYSTRSKKAKNFCFSLRSLWAMNLLLLSGKLNRHFCSKTLYESWAKYTIRCLSAML